MGHSVVGRGCPCPPRPDFVFLRDSGAVVSTPRGGYHRDCYQSYTNRKSLERIADDPGDTTGDDDAESGDSDLEDAEDSAAEPPSTQVDRSGTPTRLTRRSMPLVSVDKCIFCCKHKRKVKGKRHNQSQCLARRSKLARPCTMLRRYAEMIGYLWDFSLDRGSQMPSQES